MDVLKFTLSGKTAFFKKPDVNSYFYFTYGNIHKVALLGILGTIMGYGGYNQQSMAETPSMYPEFYQRLKEIKLGIVPRNPRGHIPKKIQSFNNSVGYANKDGTLIVREQWLERPCWDIYILIQTDLEKEIAESILSQRTVFTPYLGKNDHLADITEPSLLRNVSQNDQVKFVHSLFINDYFQFVMHRRGFHKDSIPKEPIFKYEEKLPVSLEESTNQYEFLTFVFTNQQLNPVKDAIVYQCNGQNIFFF